MCSPCKVPPECCGCPPTCCGPAISYCIFDLESAVFDTRYIYRKALKEVALSYDRRIPEHLYIQSGPMTTSEMSQLICRKCDMPIDWESFRFELNERTSQLIANPPFMDGIERLVNHLRNCCIGLGLVTSCSEANYCAKIRGREEFFENFSSVICADDPELRAFKPEPDVYLIAMSRLGDAGPDCTLVFDGTPKGVQAAADARLPVVMLADKDLPCCWSELAALRFEYLDDFEPEMLNMPPFTDPPPRRRSSRRRTRYSRRLTVIRRRAAEAAAAEEEEEQEAPPEVPQPLIDIAEPSVLNLRE
ncbi:pseudouridine-5'-phosphatase [Drosophila elegans]|uniref:pseudouridine-5'-phosphatase n=1 Tax=Drosophila elegans TaxID=30023 RepID=UPI0007E84372|nr:pseudouridine-5'-phosphatase [Drosophila elegans]